jgi:F-type H+-transporting ATPase subunit gamma
VSAKDLERQKQSVDNTAKMTQALQTISAIKLGRARNRLDRIRPYTDNMQEMMQDIARGAQSNNPLFVGREEVNTICVCTITSDRGLAGAFNSQVLRQAMGFVEQQSADVIYLATGRKAVEFFNFRSVNLDEVYTGFSDSPPYEKAQEIGRRLTELFHNEEVDEVYLFYEQFRSALSQDPTYIRLLPVAPGYDTGEEEGEEEEEEGGGNPFEFIPEPDELIDRLVPRYVETLVFRALVESAAGEHGARMAAMQNATDSANEMSESLTQQINKARQAAITQEIVEIAAAMEALGMMG